MSANRIADLNHQVSSEANEGRRNALVRQKTAVENFRRYVMRNKHAADLDSPEKLENVLKEVHGDDYGNWIRGTFGLEPLDELDEYGPREPSST
jgi:hypothetical protein